MKEIKINGEFIKLGQLLKFINVIESGSRAKEFIIENKILVNNEHETRRGRKLYVNDVVNINGNIYRIK